MALCREKVIYIWGPKDIVLRLIILENTTATQSLYDALNLAWVNCHWLVALGSIAPATWVIAVPVNTFLNIAVLSFVFVSSAS